MGHDRDHELTSGWPEAANYRRSIRLQFSLLTSGMIVVLMLVTGYIITGRYSATVTQSVVERLLVQARSQSGTAGKHLLSADGPDALMLNQICHLLKNENPDVYWVGIAEADGTLAAHTDLKQVVAKAKLPGTQHDGAAPFLHSDEHFRVFGDTVHITVPIVDNGITLGHLAIAASDREINEARRSTILSVGSITLVMLLVGIPLTMMLMHRKLRPLKRITDSLKQISFDCIDIDIPVRSRNEFGYLAETLRVMGSKLNAARSEMIEKERMARELEIAREIQASILPSGYPRTERMHFAGTYRSAREVGGDYYDFIHLGERYFGFLVADVSGKSLPGMLVMLVTRDLVRRLALQIHDPVELLCAVNRELQPSIRRGMFVTMFYGILDQQTGRFTFASAGHNPLLYLQEQADRCELIRPNGYPLGLMTPERFDKRLERHELRLQPNDWLLQYTDGVNEALNESEEEYGMDRLLAAVTRHRQHDPESLVKLLLNDHQTFVGHAPQYDDITLLAMKWAGRTVDTKDGEVYGITGRSGR